MNNNNLNKIIDFYNNQLFEIISKKLNEKIMSNKILNIKSSLKNVDVYIEEDEDTEMKDIFEKIYGWSSVADIYNTDYHPKIKEEFNIEDVEEATALINDVLLKYKKKGFFDDIFELKALRLNAILEELDKVPDNSKNKIISSAKQKCNIDNLENSIGNCFFLLFQENPSQFNSIIKNSFPLSLEKISLDSKDYKFNLNVPNLERDMLLEKEKILKEYIKKAFIAKNKKKLIYLDENLGLSEKAVSYIFENQQYNDFNISDYLYETYIKEQLFDLPIKSIHVFFKKIEASKNDDRMVILYNNLIWKIEESDDNYLLKLLDYAKDTNNFKDALNYLDLARLKNKNVNKGLIKDILTKALAENIDVKIEDLLEDSSVLYSMAKEVFTKCQYDLKRNMLIDQLTNDNGLLNIQEMESKTLTIDYSKFIYLFQRDFREQNFKQAIGLDFDGQFEFRINPEKTKVFLNFRFDGVRKMSNNVLIIDSVAIIEAMMTNAEMAPKLFNQTRLKALINTSDKENIEKKDRKKI